PTGGGGVRLSVAALDRRRALSGRSRAPREPALNRRACRTAARPAPPREKIADLPLGRSRGRRIRGKHRARAASSPFAPDQPGRSEWMDSRTVVIRNELLTPPCNRFRGFGPWERP